MEVGAVKQAFNNEIILLKKKLNQARIQVIHKLTRKAKSLAEKKGPEKFKEKAKRKAESAVNEVLILKKIKAKDLGKFIVTHKGKLADHLNKSQVDNDKACARLCLHKVLEDKYEFIRNRFSNVPIKDLFMSRIERQKIKKEEKEKQKDKRKAKEERRKKREWNVEDVEIGDTKPDGDTKQKDDDIETGNNDMSDNEADSDIDGDPSADEQMTDDNEKSDISDDDTNQRMEDKEELNETKSDGSKSDDSEETSGKEVEDINNFVTLKSPERNSKIINTKLAQKNTQIPKQLEKQKKTKKEKKNKDNNVNKNKVFNEKLQQRKFKKDSADCSAQEKKVVDPFFITATGDNYMSLAEPREPDEVKEIHKQGNRKLRRAVMFGHVPKIKPRKNNYDSNNYNNNDRYNKPNGFNSRSNNDNRFDNKVGYENRGNKFDNRKKGSDFNDRNAVKSDFKPESKPEKLHPSWEAKKKQSGILPFEGKKIVFD